MAFLQMLDINVPMDNDISFLKDSHTLKICDFIFICLLVDHEPDSPDHLRTLKRPVSFNGITIGDVEMAKVRGTVNE